MTQRRTQTALMENLTELEDRISELKAMVDDLEGSVREVKLGVSGVKGSLEEGLERVGEQVKAVDENPSRLRAELSEVKSNLLTFLQGYRNMSRMLEVANSKVEELRQEVMKLRKDVKRELGKREVRVNLVDDPAGAPS